MNYLDALQKVKEIHLRNFGRFFKDLPDFYTISSPSDIQNLFRKRGAEMVGIIKRNEINAFEFMRFYWELETISLLFVISLWGESLEEVPLIEEDFKTLDCISNGHAAAHANDEEGVGTLDVIHKLLLEGMRLGYLPDSRSPFLCDVEQSEEEGK
jgi:hypothetical protein